VRLVGQSSLSFDDLNKMLQPRGLNPDAFVEANLLYSSRGQYRPVPADKRGAEIAQGLVQKQLRTFTTESG
jgi:hypothetical protein